MFTGTGTSSSIAGDGRKHRVSSLKCKTPVVLLRSQRR